MHTNIAITILFSIIFLLILGNLFKTSKLKPINNLLLKLSIGIGTLFLINLIGKDYGIHVAMNGYTATIAGVLGIPGVAALIIIQRWII